MLIHWVQNHPALSIVLGTLMIGLGGLVATLGWESRSAYAARRAMLEVLSAEVHVNERLLNHSVFTEENPELLRVVRVIPAFSDSALRGAIASGAFTRDKDKELLDAILAMENSITYFRQLTEVYHGILIRTSGFADKAQRDSEFEKLWLGLREAASLAQLRRNLESLRRVIDAIEPKVVARPGWLEPEQDELPQAVPDGDQN